MLQRHGHISLFILMLAWALLSAPALAGQVTGVTVDVPNEQGGFVGENAVDGDPATAWVGGGKGIGPGKYVELFFEGPVTLESLRIHNGNQGKGQFDRFRRVTKGVILYPDGTRQKFTLKPSPGAQTITLQPKTVSSIKLIITGVAPSSKDKSMGKAKVAISEIAVSGAACEGEDCVAVVGAEEKDVSDVAETSAGPEEEKKEGNEKEAVKPKSAEPKPESVKQPAPEPEPAAKPAPEAKPAVEKKSPEKKATAQATEKPAKKSASQPKATPDEPEKKQAAVKKSVAKKTVAKKATPKKPTAKAQKKAPKKRAAKPTSKKGAITYQRPASPVPADKELVVGVIDPWLDLELVAQMKRYFALLTTLHDSYPDIFTADIRERERKIFVAMQEDMRAKREFNKHSIAMLEHIGLNFDKPETAGGITTVRVHGPYRYYLGNSGFEIQVDTVFSLKKENGTWLISDVRDK